MSLIPLQLSCARPDHKSRFIQRKPEKVTSSHYITVYYEVKNLGLTDFLSAALRVKSGAIGSFNSQRVPVIFSFPPLATFFAPLIAGTLTSREIPALHLMHYLLGNSSFAMGLTALAIEHTQQNWIFARMLIYSVQFSATGTFPPQWCWRHRPIRHALSRSCASSRRWPGSSRATSSASGSRPTPSACSMLVASACGRRLVGHVQPKPA